MKKFIGLMLSSFLVFGGFASVFAGQSDTVLLKSAYSNMTKASIGSYTYGWQAELVAQRPNFTDGVLTGKIGDYDNDGAQELLTLKIKNSNADGVYAVVSLDMYEVKNGVVEDVAQTDDLELIRESTDAGGLELFTKNGYIALQAGGQNNTFADGTMQKAEILSYNGNGFETKMKLELTGSTGSFECGTEVQDLKNLGFTGTSKYTSQYFNPYFYCMSVKQKSKFVDDNNGFNMALLEDNIDPIYEVIITNNRDEVSWDLDDIIKNHVMTMEFNDFSDVNSKIIVILDGDELSFEQDPYIENNTTMVPMRKIFEALGAEVEYNSGTKGITATRGGKVIEIAIDSDNAKINGEAYKLAATVKNKNGYAMVPLRFVSEALGAEVNWDGNTRIVTINQVISK